jgi:molecular chaperone GrpE
MGYARDDGYGTSRKLAGRANPSYEKAHPPPPHPPLPLDFPVVSPDIGGRTQFQNGNNVMTDTNARPTVDAAAEPETTTSPAQGAEQGVIDPTDFASVAAEYKDKLLRALAEMENLRRRTEREIADARQYAISNFARDIIAVADNMARSVSAVDASQRAQADSGLKALLEGVELTERELLKVLEKNGVRKFDPSGQKFDPNLHQAMFELPDPSRPAGTVAQVMQPGYMLGDRVLRPALVSVAKGGPKFVAEPQAAQTSNGAEPQGYSAAEERKNSAGWTHDPRDTD